jgi:PKD repeat protein
LPSQVRFIGASQAPRIEGVSRLPGIVNVFRGNIPAHWHTGIPTFTAVRYHNLYPGIDAVFRSTAAGLEYEFEIVPGADPSVIRLAVRGAEAHINAAGDLLVEGSGGQIIHRRPLAFQPTPGGAQPVVASFRRLGGREFGFDLSRYDHAKSLTIDPTVAFSTYFGGTSSDWGGGVALDRAGNIYVVGTTTSSDLPTVGESQGKTGPTDSDVFVAKLDPSGAHLLYSTYLGGSSDDGTSLFQGSFGACGPQIVVTADGSVVLTGWTASTDFPTTPGAFQHGHGGGPANAFVTKLDPSGSHLTYSTYLSGSGGSVGNALALAPDGGAYVVGFAGNGFPEVNPVAEAKGTIASAFLAKVSPDGGSLAFSTRFGGSGSDWALSAAVDTAGKVWVAGSTESADFPTKNALQSQLRGLYESCNLGDAFVARFDTTTPALEYSTYLGGTSWDYATSLAVDAQGAAYVGGVTASPDFPILGGFQTQLAPAGGCAGFFAKIAPAGTSLVFSSYVGGGYGCASPISGCPLRNDGVAGLTVDTHGDVWMTGVTTSPTFPLAQPLQGSLEGFSDVFVAEAAFDGSSLLFSTFLGGTDADSGAGIALAPDGAVVVVGTTSSTDFPVVRGLFPNSAGGRSDTFIVKLSPESAVLAASASASPLSGLAPLAVTFSGSASGGTGLYTFDWDFGDGSPHSSQQSPTNTYTLGGDYTATLKVTDSGGATATASVGISVAHNCSLACSATVPAVVPVGQAASFSASSTPYDCAGSVSYQWAFGDGATSTDASPSHTYTTPGLYAWSVVASIGSVGCTRSGTIAVASAPVNASYVLPAVAHNPGYLGTQWRSEVAVVNPFGSPATAHLTLVVQPTSGAPLFATAEVPAGGSLAWRDILASLFGQPDDASIQGALLVYADRPVVLTLRTYDQTDNGTLGSSYPALLIGEGVGAGQTGVVPGLKRNAGFRSNLGAVNVGSVTCTVVVKLYDAQGTQLGVPRTMDLAPGAWSQLNDVLSGVGTIDLAYATVVVPTANGRAWAYGSVVDNASGDPTTIPVVVP